MRQILMQVVKNTTLLPVKLSLIGSNSYNELSSWFDQPQSPQRDSVISVMTPTGASPACSSVACCSGDTAFVVKQFLGIGTVHCVQKAVITLARRASFLGKWASPGPYG